MFAGSPWRADEEGRVGLDELAREGARRMIAAALEVEVADYVERFADEVDEDGRRLVVQWPRPRAQADRRVGHRADPGAAGQRQARRPRDGRAAEVQLEDPA